MSMIKLKINENWLRLKSALIWPNNPVLDATTYTKNELEEIFHPVSEMAEEQAKPNHQARLARWEQIKKDLPRTPFNVKLPDGSMTRQVVIQEGENYPYDINQPGSIFAGVANFLKENGGTFDSDDIRALYAFRCVVPDLDSNLKIVEAQGGNHLAPHAHLNEWMVQLISINIIAMNQLQSYEVIVTKQADSILVDYVLDIKDEYKSLFKFNYRFDVTKSEDGSYTTTFDEKRLSFEVDETHWREQVLPRGKQLLQEIDQCNKEDEKKQAWLHLLPLLVDGSFRKAFYDRLQGESDEKIKAYVNDAIKQCYGYDVALYDRDVAARYYRDAYDRARRLSMGIGAVLAVAAAGLAVGLGFILPLFAAVAIGVGLISVVALGAYLAPSVYVKFLQAPMTTLPDQLDAVPTPGGPAPDVPKSNAPKQSTVAKLIKKLVSAFATTKVEPVKNPDEVEGKESSPANAGMYSEEKQSPRKGDGKDSSPSAGPENKP